MFVCANCGQDIEPDHMYICTDNYLQVKYFDDNKSNRFCSQECFCEALMLELVPDDEAPLDSGESIEPKEDISADW